MDKNTVIGLLLIFVLIFGWGYFTQPSKEEIEKARQTQDSLAQVQEKARLEEQKRALAAQTAAARPDSLENQPDSVKKQKLADSYGIFAAAMEGESKYVTLRNKLISVRLSNLGGRPFSVRLLNYMRHDSLPLELFNGDSTFLGLDFFANNRSISTRDLYFVPNTTDSLVEASGKDAQVTYGIQLDGGKKIEFVYSLPPDGYLLKFAMRFTGMQDVFGSTVKTMTLNWESKIPRQEKGASFESDNSAIFYKFHEDEVDQLSERGDEQTEDLPTRVKWIAFKQQFFSSVLIADQSFLNANLKQVNYKNQDRYLKEYKATITLPLEGKAVEQIPMQFYFGPNHFKTLSQYNLDLEKLVPLGWGIFGWVNRYLVIPIFNFLGTFMSNYGLIILILTIIIKLILAPLTYKSYLSTAKMRVLKPEIEELTKKFGKDKQMEKQQATMALYKKAGVNPMGGCLPMLLQFPILIAIFRFFPASIELRQQPFLWAEDLSSYDSILSLPFTIPWYGDHVSLFCLLMTISTVIYTYLNQKQMADTSQQLPGMNVMMYMFPVMMLFWFNSYSSGLSYYYLVTNLLSFGQMWLMKRFVDEAALHRQIAENKKKPVKKSGFQQKLEQMARDRGMQARRK